MTEIIKGILARKIEEFEERVNDLFASERELWNARYTLNVLQDMAREIERVESNYEVAKLFEEMR